MTFKNVLTVCLLFPGVVSAAQDPEIPSYEPEKNLLKIPVVTAGRDHLSVDLIDRGGFQFKPTSYAPYTGVVPNVYSSFDTDSGILTIPNLSALGKVWAVTLQLNGDLVFKLSTAQEVNTPAKLDPMEAITPNQRFTINHDGTVNDTITGLQWMRCSQGQTWNGSSCSGYPGSVEMEDAAYSAYQLNFAGKDDWRLPTIDELKTLVYCSSGKPKFWNTGGTGCTGNYQRPTLFQEAFPYNASGVYWTSTNLQNDPGQDYNLTVSFNYGHVYYSYFEDAYEHARFVRGSSNIVPTPETVGGFKE